MKNNIFLIPAVIFLSLGMASLSFGQRIENPSAKYRKDINYNDQRVFVLVNKERKRAGLEELTWRDDLAKIARNYSQKMADENFFSHYDKNGNSIEYRAEKGGVSDWRKIGENLFMCRGCQNVERFAVVGWMKSPGHKSNILDEDFTSGAIGIAVASNGAVFITQVFMAD